MVQLDKPAMADFSWENFFSVVEVQRTHYRSTEPNGKMFRLYDVLQNRYPALHGTGMWPKKHLNSFTLFKEILDRCEFEEELLKNDPPAALPGLTHLQQRLYLELRKAGAFPC